MHSLDHTAFKRVVLALCAAPLVHELIVDGEGDVPALLAIVLGLALKHTSASAVILLMVTGGEMLEEMALDRAGSSLQSLLEQNLGTARLAATGQDIAVDDVKDGDELVVRANEVVPVDGILLDASASIDEGLLTGEKLPATIVEGTRVLAGSVNKGGAPLRMRAKGGVLDSVLHQMKDQLRSALQRKSKLELASKRLADTLTPFTLGTAAVGFALARRRGAPAREAWDVVLSVLMSATPCPAAIGVPIAFLSAMNLSSRRFGATVKSGLALEALADARVVVLDKTGTLTTGKPRVVDVVVAAGSSGVDAARALHLVASLEARAKHVLADAVFKHFSTQNPTATLLDVAEVNVVDGQGVRGIVDGRFDVAVGSRAFCLGEHREGDSLEAHFIIRTSGAAATVGRVLFEDPVRLEAPALVKRLKARGLKVVILSGDPSAHLRHVAQQLGVDSFFRCLPHDKVAKVKELQSAGNKVVVVGDGGNDTPALAQADVGISVDASSMSSEGASVVLVGGDLLRVDDLIGLSQRVVSLARRTVYGGTAASLVQMLLAAGGWTNPFQNAVAQEIVDLGSIVFALQALSF